MAIKLDHGQNLIATQDGVLHLQMTGALKLPTGTTAQRPATPRTGDIRFNSDDTTFEGYDGTAWGSLGGVKDIDQDTYIGAEDSPGADNDELDFFTAGSQRMVIKNDGKVGIGTDTPTVALDVVGDIKASGNVIAQGNITLGAGGDGDTVTIEATLSSDLVPTTDNSFDLGSSSAQMAEVYTGQVKTSAGDLTLNPAGNIDVSSNRITGLAAPTDAGDATTKSYVDSAISSGGSSVQIGTPTDGKYFQTPTVDSYSGARDGATTELTSTTMVGDAIDALNEAMLNTYRNTYVRDVGATVNNATPAANQSITFTTNWFGNPDSIEINYGDGNQATDTTLTTASDNTGTTTFSHAYASSGSYNVVVTGTNNSGTGSNAVATRTYSSMVTVFSATPVVGFSMFAGASGGSAITHANEGATVYLENTTTNTGTALGNGNTATYTVNWGDGNSDTVASDTAAGGVDGARLSHTYASTGDTRYTITLTLNTHSTAAPADIPANTTANFDIYENTISPTFSASVTSGNNEESTNGLVVTFTNNTTGSPGATSTFSSNKYTWVWDDGTTNDVNIGSGASGDTGQTISHTFAHSATDQANGTVKTYDVKLQVHTLNSATPFESSATTITVNPDPRANAAVTFTNAATGISGASNTKGYAFVGYDGNNYAEATGVNTSQNATSYTWTWGDGDTDTVATTATQTHDYTSAGTGTYNGSLLAFHSTYSTGAADDTEAFSVQILATPAAPDALSTKTLAFTTEDTGISPKLASGFTDNTGGSTYSAGDSVNRTTENGSGQTESDVLSTYAYNAGSGTLTAFVNGSADGAITFSAADNSGSNSALTITEDIDANAVNASGASASGSTYPNNFYRVFKAKVGKTSSGIANGVNSYQLQHSASGNTNTLEFVKDDVTATPTVATAGAATSENTAGTQRYISGIPYYNSGGVINVTDLTITDFIGQTYRDTTSVVEFVHASNDEGTSGNIISTQNKTYANLDGASTFLSSGIPIANTGNGSTYALGSQTVSINGTARAVGQIRVRGNNVNGTGSYQTVPTKIQVYSQSVTGFNEEDITVTSLGSGFTDNAKRVVFSGLTGATPAYTGSTNYYTTDAWTGNITVAGTDNAIVRFGQLKHFDTDLSSGYLPVGPDLNTGRSGTQYFRGAFRRSLVANFKVTITGKISGFKIAAPGSGIDSASNANGWIDATIPYAGSGVPGANTGSGGNGSQGCARTSGDTIPTGSVLSNQTYELTLGSENLSNATGNQLLFSIELANGDYIDSLSFGS